MADDTSRVCSDDGIDRSNSVRITMSICLKCQGSHDEDIGQVLIKVTKIVSPENKRNEGRYLMHLWVKCQNMQIG